MLDTGNWIQGKDVVYFLRKQMWLMLLVFAAVSGSTFFYALGLPDMYVAGTKIAITPQFLQQVLPRQMVSYESFYLTNLTFETELQIMRSEPLSRRVAWVLADGEQRGNEEYLERETAAVKGALRVRRIESTRLVEIQARSPEPKRAAAIANTAAEQYIYLTAENRLEAYRKSQTWLQEQIADLEIKVQLSEQALIDYIKKENLVIAEGTPIPGNAAAESEAASDMLSVLRTQLVEAELEYNRLSRRYKEKHPTMVALDQEISLIKSKIEEERSRTRGARVQAREEAIEFKEKAIRYNLLKRAAETNKQLYDSMIARLRETDVTAEVSQPDIQVIEQAKVPGAPVYPDRQRINLIGGVSGLFLALLLALGVEWLDPRIRSIEEFQHLFDLPVLGTIPRMKDTDLGEISPSRISIELPKSVAGESFRTLRTNVKFSHARNSGNMLLVTSPVPKEGKTTVSSNLASTIALSGQKVVLVDGDLRNPGVSNAFNLHNGPGLAHLLSGEITHYREALHDTSVENLSLIPAGLIPPNPSELLDSQVLMEILGALSKDFDQVVIDSAPVLAVADTSIIASVARNVLLVLGMDAMNRTLIQRAMRQLEGAGAHLYGAVLNRLPAEGQGYYYYAYSGAYSADAK